MTLETRDGELTLRAYARVLRLRWWVVVIPLVLVPLAAIAFSARQTAQYQSTAHVLLSRQNLASALTGTEDPTLSVDAQRYVETQAALVQVPAVAKRALATTGLTDRSVVAYLGQVSVTPRARTDILQITVSDKDPSLAQQLATAHAREYVAFRTRLDTATLRKARNEVAVRIAELEASGQQATALYQRLQDTEQLLATIDTLQTARATLVRSADIGVQVSPSPSRNGLLGLFLGAVLGVGLAFLIDAFDTRLRRTEDISEVLAAPMLARLPEPPKKLQKTDGLVMLAQPSSAQAEAFRVLRTNLEFAALDQNIRTILVTSAVEEEGKSTTVSNLAVALARAGRKVVLVDLDLRRPSLDRFFDLGPSAGITNVVLGDATLETALARVDIGTGRSPKVSTNPSRRPLEGNGTANAQNEDGWLELLPAGPPPPNPGEFVGSQRVREIVESLERRADVVIIDAPPVLRIGDAMTLSALVDGGVIVVEQSRIRAGMLNELRRTVTTLPAPLLGFVVTGVDGDESGYLGYAGYAYRHYTVRPESEIRRVSTPDADRSD